MAESGLKMRILIITQKVDESDDVLGFFISWIKAIARRVEHVDVICLAKGSYELPQNVKVVSLGKEKGWPKIIRALVFYWNLLKFLPQVDGVFVHMAPEYVRALYPLNILFKKPVVMWYAHIKVSPTAKWALGHVNFVLTPSKESFEYDSHKVVATGHGINTSHFQPMDAQPQCDLLALSRISKVKRVEILIEAVKILRDRGRNVSVSIYGKPARPEDAEYLESLRNLVDQYGLGDQIQWMGSVSNKDTPRIYASHGIHVRMQPGGGFGKTELEAMSMGIPCILPTEVYKKDLEEFGEEMYFPEDDAEALADRILGVLSWDTAKRSSYAHLARRLVVSKHNIENIAEKLVNLIKQCAA